MRAITVTDLSGPAGVAVLDIPEPVRQSGHVLIGVRTVGVSWPDLLLSCGEYQLKPEPPFQLGVDFAGEVLAADEGSEFSVGDRVASVLPYGGGAELVAVSEDAVFPLPESISFEQAAAIPMNYLTAEFALATRGQLAIGQSVLINGAAGGVGSAAIQVARGLGLRTIALVSTTQKAETARRAGADEVVLPESFKDRVRELTDGRGVDAVLDVVGGDLVTDALRCLAEEGRLLVVGFTGGSIPEVKVNRLLLNNIDVRGVGWGAYAMTRPGYLRAQWDRLLPMMNDGVIDPPLAPVRRVEDFGDVLTEMAGRRVLGKVVVSF